MINLGNNIHLPLSPENNLNPGNEYFPPNNEQNLNDVYYQMETDRINKDFNDSEENNCISHEKPFIEPNDIFFLKILPIKKKKLVKKMKIFVKKGFQKEILTATLYKNIKILIIFILKRQLPNMIQLIIKR